MALIASAAYHAITVDVERLMRDILHAVPEPVELSDVTDYLGGLVVGELMGIHRAWSIAARCLVGSGDELFVADCSRLLRLSRGQV